MLALDLEFNIVSFGLDGSVKLAPVPDKMLNHLIIVSSIRQLPWQQALASAACSSPTAGGGCSAVTTTIRVEYLKHCGFA